MADTLQRISEAKNASATRLQDSVPSPRAIKNHEYAFETFKASSLSSVQRSAIWKIFEENMRQAYTASSFGWDPPQKKRELFHRESRFILVHDLHSRELLAFSMFRFDTEDNMDGDEDPVVYCYELQVSRKARKLGLGAALMSDLESLGRDWKMKKVMLTCFLTNVDAMAFYKRVGFTIDPISPSQQQSLGYPATGDEDDEWVDEEEAPADYEILSKTV